MGFRRRPDPPGADPGEADAWRRPPEPAAPGAPVAPAGPPAAVRPPLPAGTPLPKATISAAWNRAPVVDVEGVVRAAGGVVWTLWGGSLRVVVVHRPRQDDWSLPKGKASPGESDTACAVREVEEETGLSCSLGPELGTVSYRDRHGRPKSVRFFAMEPMGGEFAPNGEVDQLRWVSVDDARRLLSYEHDQEMVETLAASFEAPAEEV